MSLESIQNCFINCLFQCPVASQGSLEKGLQGILTHSQRFFIYQLGYRARIYASLEETYPKTLQAIALECDVDFIEDYVASYRFSSFDIFGIGEHFPFFVKSHVSFARAPYLAELAKAELSCAKSFHKPHKEPLSFYGIASKLSKSPDSLELHLQPWVEIFESHFNIVAITKKLDKVKKTSGCSEIKWDNSVCYHLIKRERKQTRIEIICPIQALFLCSLKSNPSFANAFEVLEKYLHDKRLEKHPLFIAEWLKNWADSEMFIEQLDINR